MSGALAETDANARDRLDAIRERIAHAAERSGRREEDVRLIAVSKRQPLERIAALVRAGARDLGENLVQEARDKREALLAAIGDAEPPRWHLIGALQRNKAALAVNLFDTIETVDRASLARELQKRAEAAGRSALPVLLQVNVSREEQKSGVLPEAAAELLAECSAFPLLQPKGLMAIPAAGSSETARAAFAQVRELRDTLRREPGGEALTELSMGMSLDFEIAIEEGATSVRVGTALFGEREARAARTNGDTA